MPASATVAGLLVALAFAAPAAAQAPPPDERAAARAFADAALRFDAALREQANALVGNAPSRTRGCRPLLRRMPERRKRGVGVLLVRDEIRASFAIFAPLFDRFRGELHEARTHDPALRSGRAAWRQVGRVIAAAPEPGSPCAEVRAWRDAGFPRATIRRALAENRVYLRLPGREFDRKVAAASRRLQALGVPPLEAATFAAPGESDAQDAPAQARAAS